jgi:hypothetical protein
MMKYNDYTMILKNDVIVVSVKVRSTMENIVNTEWVTVFSVTVSRWTVTFYCDFTMISHNFAHWVRVMNFTPLLILNSGDVHMEKYSSVTSQKLIDRTYWIWSAIFCMLLRIFMKFWNLSISWFLSDNPEIL